MMIVTWCTFKFNKLFLLFCPQLTLERAPRFGSIISTRRWLENEQEERVRVYLNY